MPQLQSPCITSKKIPHDTTKIQNTVTKTRHSQINKFFLKIPNVMELWGGAFPRWLSHEGGALMNRVSVLKIEVPDRTLSPSTLWGYGVHLWGSRTSPDTESAGTIITDFPAPRNVRNKYVLFVSHPIYSSFVLVAYSLNYRLPWWLSGEKSAYNAEDAGSIPGSGRSPGEGNGNPLQYSCLGNAIDRGAYGMTVHGAAKGSDTV